MAEPIALPCPHCGTHAFTRTWPAGVEARCGRKPACAMWMSLSDWNSRVPCAAPPLPAEVPEGCVRVSVAMWVSEDGRYDTKPFSSGLYQMTQVRLVADIPIPRAAEVVAQVEVKP